MSQPTDPGPTEPPYGQGAGGGQEPYDTPADPYAPQPDYGQQPPYGQQPQYGQQQYPPPATYGDQYAQQQVYGQPGYGPYGTSAVPAKPPHVIIAAVLGFVFGALGLLVSLGLILGGAFFGDLVDSLDSTATGAGGVVTGVLVFFGLIALAWTVVIIWGSVWALQGRSRVMLLVAGSIALVVTLIGFVGSLSDSSSTGGGIVVGLLFLLAAAAIVVLLCLKPAADFFAAHRARRRV